MTDVEYTLTPTGVEIEKDAIRYLGDLQRIDVRPGDLFVITCSARLNTEQKASIQHEWHRRMGQDVRMVVLSGGLALTVFNIEDALWEQLQP